MEEKPLAGTSPALSTLQAPNQRLILGPEGGSASLWRPQLLTALPDLGAH